MLNAHGNEIHLIPPREARDGETFRSGLIDHVSRARKWTLLTGYVERERRERREKGEIAMEFRCAVRTTAGERHY